MILEHLAPLAGDWYGQALISPPEREPIELQHTEVVRTHNGGTVITIEVRSFPLGSDLAGDPVFSAFAVVSIGKASLRWHAFSEGPALETECELSRGSSAWSAPTAPSARYIADFDADHWHESGTITLHGGEHEIFSTRLTRTVLALPS